MRFTIVAVAVCLCLLPLARGADVPETAAPGAPAPGAAAPGSPAAAPGDAAAKHAKRTACLKDAKARKLVGADKTSFLKNCIAAP